MNIHTIIETLKGNAVTETDGKLELTEDSFLPEVINKTCSAREDSQSFTARMRWQDYKRRCLPITWLLLTAACFLLRCIVYAVYWLTNRIGCLFSGRRTSKPLGTSPRVNLVLMVAVVVVYFMMLVSMLTFFIKDVVLFRPEPYVNDSGAICFPQSSEREHYMFLLNAAQCWTNTGIKVLKGDRITVTASGSFYHRIAEMDSLARQNLMPSYSRVQVLCNLQGDSSKRQLWMYHQKDARFGSLLVQIKDDYKTPSYNSDKGNIIQIKIARCGKMPSFTAKSAGVLNFTVNDVSVNEGRNIKYDDNVGDILLSIRIDRKKVFAGSLVPSCLAWAYYSIDKFFFSQCLCWRLSAVVLCLLLWLAMDFRLGHYMLSKILTFIHWIKSK